MLKKCALHITTLFSIYLESAYTQAIYGMLLYVTVCYCMLLYVMLHVCTKISLTHSSSVGYGDEMIDVCETFGGEIGACETFGGEIGACEMTYACGKTYEERMIDVCKNGGIYGDCVCDGMNVFLPFYVFD
jgi:hypothetical protein